MLHSANDPNFKAPVLEGIITYGGSQKSWSLATLGSFWVLFSRTPRSRGNLMPSIAKHCWGLALLGGLGGVSFRQPRTPSVGILALASVQSITSVAILHSITSFMP